MAGLINGFGTDLPGVAGFTDAAGNAFTLSADGALSGGKGHGYAINVGGADSAFPGNRCRQLFLKDGVAYGYEISYGWFKYVGAAWVATNNPRDF